MNSFPTKVLPKGLSEKGEGALQHSISLRLRLQGMLSLIVKAITKLDDKVHCQIFH